MAVKFDLGSLIVAVLMVLFTFNPQVISLISWVYRQFRLLCFPHEARCDLVLWRDFNGHLHCHSGQHPSSCSFCEEARKHSEVERCWLYTFALVFNNAWNSKNRKKFSKKPWQLALGEKYLRTEARVILAYFLCTARVNSFSAEMLGSRLDYVHLEEENGLLIGHLGPAQRVLLLEKIEIERILDGWPPFYRQTFRSSEGDFLLDSPLVARDHVRRPAWVVAIGLGQVQPTDVYVTKDGEQPLFDFAICRVKWVLEERLKKEWPDRKIVKSTIAKMDSMLKEGTSTGYEDLTWVANTSETVSYPVRNQASCLSEEQCRTLIQVFHQMTISSSEKAILDPKLDDCMDRVLLGAAVALKYSSTARTMKIPPCLQGDKVVYLGDCKPRDA